MYFFRVGLIIIPYLSLDFLSGGFPSILKGYLIQLLMKINTTEHTQHLVRNLQRLIPINKVKLKPRD